MEDTQEKNAADQGIVVGMASQKNSEGPWWAEHVTAIVVALIGAVAVVVAAVITVSAMT